MECGVVSCRVVSCHVGSASDHVIPLVAHTLSLSLTLCKHIHTPHHTTHTHTHTHTPRMYTSHDAHQHIRNTDRTHAYAHRHTTHRQTHAQDSRDHAMRCVMTLHDASVMHAHHPSPHPHMTSMCQHPSTSPHLLTLSAHPACHPSNTHMCTGTATTTDVDTACTHPRTTRHHALHTSYRCSVPIHASVSNVYHITSYQVRYPLTPRARMSWQSDTCAYPVPRPCFSSCSRSCSCSCSCYCSCCPSPCPVHVCFCVEHVCAVCLVVLHPVIPDRRAPAPALTFLRTAACVRIDV